MLLQGELWRTLQDRTHYVEESKKRVRDLQLSLQKTRALERQKLLLEKNLELRTSELATLQELVAKRDAYGDGLGDITVLSPSLEASRVSFDGSSISTSASVETFGSDINVPAML